MFTGIIKIRGRLDGRQTSEGGLRLFVTPTPPIGDLEIGESIAVNGVCLTAEPGSRPGNLIFFLSSESLTRSTLGELETGAALNLERALTAHERLGGHIVLGHVDAVGEIRRWERRGEAWELEIAHPSALAPFMAEKGSVAIDGISLTLATSGEGVFTVAVIPHTAASTTLDAAAPGLRVNLEADVLARYAVRALEYAGSAGSAVTEDLLRQAGF